MSFQMKINLWLRQGMCGEASGTKVESTEQNEKPGISAGLSQDFVA
jgi:hypothetical protein